MPQTSESRANCQNEDYRAHYLTMQGSINEFQWRIKRPAANGFCTIRVSVDDVNFHPLMPEGVNAQRFPCGRHFGYESGKFRLPRGLINRNEYAEGAALLQLEYETDYGTIVQCADLVIQK